jgi:hypothetical protein
MANDEDDMEGVDGVEAGEDGSFSGPPIAANPNANLPRISQIRGEDDVGDNEVLVNTSTPTLRCVPTVVLRPLSAARGGRGGRGGRSHFPPSAVASAARTSSDGSFGDLLPPPPPRARQPPASSGGTRPASTVDSVPSTSTGGATEFGRQLSSNQQAAKKRKAPAEKQPPRHRQHTGMTKSHRDEESKEDGEVSKIFFSLI